MNVREVGSYIRSQRVGARLSLAKMSGLAGVSIPYLSQIERGLRKPSADILQAIAKGLRISAETLYVQAGILDERPIPDVATSIMGDPTITERQKQALIQIYQAFREETGRTAPEEAAAKSGTNRSRRRDLAGRKAGSKRGEGVEPQAVPSPHRASLRPLATKPRKEV
jgi:transcriptional regulator with XRE-family HTH domain